MTILRITPSDTVKDAALALLGFYPSLLMHLDTALTLGLLNLLVVVVFRVVELRLKYKQGKGEVKRNE